MITRRSLLAAGVALVLPLPARADAALPPIQQSELAVELVDWLTLPRTRNKKPYACLNQLKPWGAYLYICDTRGKLWRVHPATRSVALWLDMALARNGALVTIDSSTGADAVAWGGFRDFAFDPAGHYVYTSTVETVASRPTGVRVFPCGVTPLYDCVLAEWRIAEATGRRVASELFRMRSGRSTTTSAVAVRGRQRAVRRHGRRRQQSAAARPVQSCPGPGLPAGQWLRIKPYRTTTAPYSDPQRQPLRSTTGARPEIDALGLRHPMNACLRDVASGPLIFSDVGQARIEEVNLLRAGANYGWPLREGHSRRPAAATKASP